MSTPITTSVLNGIVLSIFTFEEYYKDEPEHLSYLLQNKNLYSYRSQQYYMAVVKFDGEEIERSFDIGTNRIDNYDLDEENEGNSKLFSVGGRASVDITDGPLGRTLGSLKPAY